jgi:hypothetical protein
MKHTGFNFGGSNRAAEELVLGLDSSRGMTFVPRHAKL